MLKTIILSSAGISSLSVSHEAKSFGGRDDLKKPLFAVATFDEKKLRPNSAEVLID